MRVLKPAMVAVRWEAVPPTIGGGRPPMWEPGASGDGWEHIAAQLRQRPRQWAVIFETNTPAEGANLVMIVKQGRYPSFRPGASFDACLRIRVEDRVHRVFARWLGYPPCPTCTGEA